MSNDPVQVLLHPGRIVSGDPYTKKTKDGDGNPMTDKEGNPTFQYYFAVAIPKTPGARHWGEEEWGKLIWAKGNEAMPKIAESPTFSWKIVDGDSVVPNKKGIAPNSRQGYPGHWVVSLTANPEFPFKITNADGSAYILEEGVVHCGDIVRVHVSVRGNETQRNPGVYLNTNFVAFLGCSPLGRISFGPDPRAVLAGASGPTMATVSVPTTAPRPAAPALSPAPAAQVAPPPLPAASAAPAPAPAPVAVAPAPSYLAAPLPAPAPAPAPSGLVLTMVGEAAKNGWTYELLIAQGWTQEGLIAQGYLKVG